jgi:hypothetical protein
MKEYMKKLLFGDKLWNTKKTNNHL